MTDSSATTVRALLARYGGMAHNAVLEAVPVHEPRRDLYDLVLQHLLPRGKGLRPAILAATCRALGGDLERAIALAVPIELLHSAFLVHDDIQDASVRRRGKLALHEAHGVPLALNAGDALAALAARELGRVARPYNNVGISATEEFQDVVQRTIEGQAMEIGFRSHLADASETDYIEIITRKTSGYTTILPMRFGALAATGQMPPRGQFERFGFYLGALFQLRNDIRDLWPNEPGDSPAGSDIAEGKLTLMTVHALRVAPKDQSDALLSTLRAPDADDARIQAAIEIIEHAGGHEYADDCAHALANAATAAFTASFERVQPSPDRSFLGDLVHYILEN